MSNEGLIIIDVTPQSWSVRRGGWSTRAEGQREEVMPEKSR